MIAKQFVPGEEASDSQSRVHLVIDRVREMTDGAVAAGLAAVRSGFADRHRDLDAILERHVSLVSARLHDTGQFSRDRRLLLGAYLTHEFSVEGAALCSPSMVRHPDQTGLRESQARFVLSVRAIGEGHLSSIEFRTGIVWSGGIALDDPGTHLTMGIRTGRDTFKAMMFDHLNDLDVDPTTASQVLSELPAAFSEDALGQAMAALHPHLLARHSVQQAARHARGIASCRYRVSFPPWTPLGEQLIWPHSAAERHGMEDLRLVRFAEGDAPAIYHGTYTAYDGDHVTPHRLTTRDFQSYDIGPLAGPAARNKGLALFPRRVGGRHLALSRWDRESLSLATSADGHFWKRGPVVRPAADPWEFVQVGNCGSPIETHAGWLVLTHGVGPMRTYGIGAILLDLDEPEHVLAETAEPLLLPTMQERDGYVPNVVYSCGGLLHDGTLTIPYGISDTAVAFAQVELGTLLAQMRRHSGQA
ncbi:glycoside hydrolase family 130 protein [Hamadaea sp. NPDC051192]|uniref:glycoside hydrolase family 130 protein n=1 Tax=Hamadaea sp. NPDC051192 TaxID=3154940 RepID=UPI003447A60E